MLLVNEHLDKLAAARVDFQMQGMLKDSLFGSVSEVVMRPPSPDINKDDDGDAVNSPDVLAEVKLARTPGNNFSVIIILLSDSTTVPAAKAPWNLSLLAQ